MQLVKLPNLAYEETYTCLIFILQLQVKVEEQYVKFRNENEIKSGEACKKLLSDLYQKIVETDYSFVGGYKKYEEDMEELFDTYKKTPQLEDVVRNAVIYAFIYFMHL